MKRNIFLLLLLFGCFHTRAQDDTVSLEDVVALAVEKNYDIQLARRTSDLATLDDRYAKGAFLPRVNATGAIVWNENDQELDVRNRTTEAIDHFEGETASNNLNGAVQLVWTLFDGTKMFATRERLAVIAEQGELIVREQVVNTIATVTTAYYDIVRQMQQLEAIREQMSVSEERVKLAERKFQVGIGAKPELLQAKVDYNAQRAQAIQQEAVIAQLKEQLNALVGQQLPRGYEVSDTILINLELHHDQLVQSIEETNPTLLRVQKNLKIASLSVRERRAELLPLLDFNAAYNYSRIENTKLLNPYGLLFSLSDGFNYGFSVNIPIFNGMNQKRLIQQSKINLQQQEIAYEQQKVNVNVSLVNAFIDYDNARKVLIVEEENILLARENVSIALEVFRRGASTFVELRTAQQSLADAYTRLINARYLAKAAETELLRLSGSLN
jgi:outer membrane protein TolC